MIITTLILSIIEGLTEFIPVSSTAHILLAGELLGVGTEAILPVLAIAIQSGAIVAAIWYFWRDIWADTSLILKTAIGFIPTALVGVTLYPIIKPLFSSPFVIAIALIVGGIGLIIIKPNDSAEKPVLRYKDAILIGCMQVFSFIPGVSRSGATLIGGSLLGINREHIVRFSFLLGIPTILGASVVALADTAVVLGTTELLLIVGGACVSFLTALCTMKWFIALLSKKPLSWFGWYRIVVGMLVLVFLV